MATSVQGIRGESTDHDLVIPTTTFASKHLAMSTPPFVGVCRWSHLTTILSNPSSTSAHAMATPKTRAASTVVVGGGVAGLAAANRLVRALGPRRDAVVLLERSDAVGGRVRTDVVDGFLLDRGFQIFLTSYPSAKALLDYEQLRLQPFYAGALVRCNGAFERVADPVRHPWDGVLSLANPIGNVLDKLRVGSVRIRALLGALEQEQESTTMESLVREGFTTNMIDRFFRPFLGGIFFDNQLNVTSKLFAFVMKSLATGQNCLPEDGIGAVAKQLAEKLPPGTIVLDAEVVKVDANGVELADGSRVEAEMGVIVATEGPVAANLLGVALEEDASSQGTPVGTCNLYFAAPRPPVDENVLFLNGEGKGMVNNCCFPSSVSRSYAPEGQALISASTVGVMEHLGEKELELQVREHMAEWFGKKEVDTWTHLRTYRIPYAQPNQTPPTNLMRSVRLSRGLYVCGDHREAATLDGALHSGLRAAEALLADNKDVHVDQ